MLKNLIVYRIAAAWQADLATVEEALTKTPFAECGATQEKSIGWVPPRGDAHGLFAESVGGQWILRFMVESKVLPGSVLARKVKEKAARIEKETGRKPGKKESKELKEEAKLDLLPMAFTKQASMWVWLDPVNRLLILDTSSQGRADEVVSLLVDALPGLSVALLDTQTSPQAAMSHWLSTQEPPAGFSVDRATVLKSADESKAVVKYGRHPLDIKEVQAHIAAGKLPTELAMTWDDRVSFVLTEGLQLKKLAFLDTVFEGGGKDDGGLDTDVAIATGELVKLIPDLVEALGGEGRTELSATARNPPAGIDHIEIRGSGVSVTTEAPCSSFFGQNGPDPIYQEAVDLVVKDRKASISYVQRKLRIGYNRAAGLLEDMAKAGLVSAMDSGGGRRVL